MRKMYIYIFHHRILGGENKFECIFTPVYWGEKFTFFGEKIYLNLFSPPYFWGRKHIQIYFHRRIFFWGGGGENIFKSIFTTAFLGKKINLNLFSVPFIGERK